MNIDNSKLPLVYIASPYTDGDSFINVRRQIEVADEIVKIGAVPFWPLASAFHNFLFPHDYSYWMMLDFQYINRCDVLYRLKGTSAGADLEIKYAINNVRIPVIYEDFDGLQELQHFVEIYKRNNHANRS